MTVVASSLRVVAALAVDAADVGRPPVAAAVFCSIKGHGRWQPSWQCRPALKDLVRARSAREARILQAVGASEIIELETEMGRMFGRRLVGKPGEAPHALPMKTQPPADPKP